MLVNSENKMTTKAVVERLLKAVWAHVITPHGNGGSHEDLPHAHSAHILVPWTECPRANANERTKPSHHSQTHE